jgi:hypothetical protein
MQLHRKKSGTKPAWCNAEIQFVVVRNDPTLKILYQSFLLYGNHDSTSIEGMREDIAELKMQNFFFI